MKKLKLNKGITLIALVVTIIVLLILAGISITAIVSEDERKEIEKKGHVVIGSRDIAIEKNGFTTYTIEGISISKDGPFVTTGSISGKTGNLEIVGDIQETTFKYTLTNFMQGDEIFFVKVNIDGEEYFQELKIIQGDKVEYQEDFVGIEYLVSDASLMSWENVENEFS